MKELVIGFVAGYAFKWLSANSRRKREAVTVIIDDTVIDVKGASYTATHIPKKARLVNIPDLKLRNVLAINISKAEVLDAIKQFQEKHGISEEKPEEKDDTQVLQDQLETGL